MTPLTDQEVFDIISALYTHKHRVIEPMITMCAQQYDRAAVKEWTQRNAEIESTITKMKGYQS